MANEVQTPKNVVSVQSLQNAVIELTRLVHNYVLKVEGKQLSTEDFTSALKTKLDGLSNYNDAAITQRVAAIEAIMGDASAPDNDNIINKVVEFVAFFANITEDKTLAGMLATLRTELEAEIEHISYDSNSGKLKKTVNGHASDICSVVTSGFSITQDDTNGIDTFAAVGSATITEDNTNGLDVLNF